MLVGPPENMKTTIAMCLEKYTNALVCGDMNVKQLVKLRDKISSGRYRTIVLPAFEKLYKRDQDTAANVEGHLQAMTEEGFGHASFEDHEVFVRVAKCLVIGALVEEQYRRNAMRWLRDGFMRRFLWSQFIMEDPDAIRRAICKWEPLQIGGNDDLPGLPVNRIPFDVSSKERIRIAGLIGDQEGKSTPYVLSIKILNILKWRYRDMDNSSRYAMDIFEDFSQSLGKQGAALKL